MVDNNLNTRVSDTTAVTFSVKCFNPLKLFSVTKHLQKVVFFIRVLLFIHEHLINNLISDGKSYCCNNSFTDVRFASLLAKNIQCTLKNVKIWPKTGLGFFSVEMSIAAKVLSPLSGSCCFLCIILSLTDVIKYCFCIC